MPLKSKPRHVDDNSFIEIICTYIYDVAKFLGPGSFQFPYYLF